MIDKAEFDKRLAAIVCRYGKFQNGEATAYFTPQDAAWLIDIACSYGIRAYAQKDREDRLNLAGHIMGGIMSNPVVDDLPSGDEDKHIKIFANVAVKSVDALLTELDK